ncbi:MAG TPA: hypothetical protein VL244_08765 [Alphaproteobacteria bacterium]|nr:hypothetical protein [Alphaproteobacteria bacterium]
MPQHWKAHRSALLWTLPIAGALLVLAYPPEFAAFIFRGGARVLAYNAALALLVPTLLLAWLALGSLWYSLMRAALRSQRAAADTLLLAVIAGSALTSIVGTILGVLSLLWAPIAAALILAACYGLLLCGDGHLAPAWRLFRHWLTAEDLATEPSEAAGLQSLARALRAIVLLLLAATALVRAVYFDADNTDVVQFYIPYLEEVRHQHSIWLAPDRPIYADFLVGRGNGVYLLAASLANGLVGHAVSSAYFILLALMARAFVAAALAGGRRAPTEARLAALLPDLATLLLAALLLGGVPFGKFYLQSAVWFIALLYGSLLYVADGDDRGALVRLLLPLAVAVPLSLPQYQAFAAGILAIAAAGLTLKGEGTGGRGLLALFAAGSTACLASLALNWIYLGVPELMPYWLFAPLMIPRIFQHYSSTAAQLYTNYIQGYTSSFLNLNAGSQASFGLPAALSAPMAWLTTAGEVLLVAAGLAVLRGLRPLRRLAASPGAPWAAIALAALALAALRALAGPTAGAAAPTLGLAFRSVLLGLAAAAGGGFCAGLRTRGASFGSALRNPGGLFGLALAVYLALAGLFVALVRSGSLARLMQPTEALLPALGLILAGLTARRLGTSDSRGVASAWWLGRHRAALARALVESVTALALVVAGTALQRELSAHPPLAVLRYLAGLDGREASIALPPRPFDKCLELAQALPGSAPVLHLNGYSAMSYCMFSPLLPRDKLVHQYESAFARHFRDAVFSTPERAREVYRSLGIDFFLVEKHDIDFWAPGLSPLTDDANLPRYFDLYAETPSFYLLTWRGQGRGEIPAPALTAIERWRNMGLQGEGFMVDDVLLGHWRALLWMGMERPRYPWGSPIQFREGGNSGFYLEHGWSGPSAAGTWTLSSEAELVLDVARAPAAAARLTVTAEPFTPPARPVLETTVVANGSIVGRWLFVAGEREGPRSLVIPADVLHRAPLLRLAFRFDDPKSPRALGLSSDTRELGLFVRSVSLGDAQAPAAASYRLGTAIDFSAKGNAAPYLGEGWLAPDEVGSWSVGRSAELRLALAAPPEGDGLLTITASALTGRLRPEVSAIVLVNGTFVGGLTYGKNEPAGARTLTIPHALLTGAAPLRFTFELSDSRPPRSLDLAPDPRPLGLSVRSLRLDAK